jgi:Collagen triple helix repeat (20 copies)
LLAAGGGWAFAATTTSGGVIHACVSKHGGALRLAPRCKSNERAISWNAQGIPGTNGTNGINGRNGTSGTNGTNGTSGTNGTNGAPGTARAYGDVSASETLSRSKNATVSRPFTGVYCITPAAGIDPATTGVVATPDFVGDSTTVGTGPDNSAHVEFLHDAA